MKFNRIFYVVLLLVVALFLYWNILISNKPLGLDTLGHLSKVSYIKEFGFAKWDMSWYNGAPFLKFYSPLYYLILALFGNVFFGSNFLCFLSIFLTSLGIFLLVDHLTKKSEYGFISGLLFLSVLNISYYAFSTGNQPFVFAIFTIPFSMFFLEKALNNRRYFILFSFTLLFAIYSHIFVGFCIIFISGMRFLLNYGVNWKGIKKGFIFCFIFILPGILLSCFWLFPFLTNSSSYAGDNAGYIPSIYHLLGFGNYMIWGAGAGEIGMAFAFFLICSILFFYRRIKNNYIIFLFISSIILFLLLEGILGKYYPNGIGAIRFILPFSIIICIFSGIVLSHLNLRKISLLFIFLFIILGLYFSYNMINLNYKNYSYGDSGSRFYFINEILKDRNFPLENNFNNYRFGTVRYVFSETMNFLIPAKSQTYGYHDQGILFPRSVDLMRDKIWRSEDINSTIYFLDWFGIDYFEIGGEDLNFSSKFENSSLFSKRIDAQIADYRFKLFEYNNKKPLISYVKTNVVSYSSLNFEAILNMSERNQGIDKIVPIETSDKISLMEYYSELEFDYSRKSPDVVFINYSYVDGGVVLFKEFYHYSWKAKDAFSNKPIKIYRAGPGFMMVIPEKDSGGVIFYQGFNLVDYIGIFLSVIGIFLIGFVLKKDLIKKL